MDIQHDAEWLIHMVENLLSVTKITGGTTNLKKQDEIIVRQSRFIKSLATELSHLRNMLNVEASEDERLDAGIIEEVKEEYVSMREP